MESADVMKDLTDKRNVWNQNFSPSVFLLLNMPIISFVISYLFTGKSYALLFPHSKDL